MHGPNVIALKPRTEPAHEVQPQNMLDAAGFRRIERLRYFANCYALHPQGDWEQACRIIAAEPGASLESHAFAMLGALDAYALRPVTFYQQRAQSLSEGELWVGRLLTAVAQSDQANIHALLSFRLSPVAHRRVAFLAAGLLEAFSFEQKCT